MIVNRDELKQYLLALVASADIFLLLSLYLWLRRGYYDLYIANKAFGSASLIVIGIVLLIGPLSRLYQRFDSWIIYRKELGMVGFLAALAHTVISLFLLPDKFQLASFFKFTSLNRGLVPFLFGLTSLIVMVILFVLSFERIVEAVKLNKEQWWKLQYRGVRVASLLLFLHLVVMKYPGWINWYAKGGGEELALPYLPPGSIIAASFGLFVILARLIELAGTKIARVATPVFFVLLLIFWIGSTAWGKQKTPAPLPIKWETCTKLPGSRVLEMYPTVCIATDGRRAVEPSGR